MAIFCDLMILFLAVLRSFVKAGLVPVEELETLLMPYTGAMLWAIIGLFVLKYVVYGIFMFRDIRYLSQADKNMPVSNYYILAAYPLCDLLRMLMLLGIVAGIFNGLVAQYGTFPSAASHVALIVLVVVAVFVDYFSKDGERWLSQLIPTAVFAVLVVVVSKGMFLQGLKLL